MSFHFKRNLLIFATLMLIMHITKGQDDPPPAESEGEDDSSSEETVEDSNESRQRRRRRRSLEVPDDISDDPTKPNGNDQNPARALPGLPDPATIIKIVEILKAVGEQVIPILTSGNSGTTEFVSKRISRDMNFLKSLKNQIDVLTENLIKQK